MAAVILCLPSYREGFGPVVIEAAASGLPAMVSSIYGLTMLSKMASVASCMLQKMQKQLLDFYKSSLMKQNGDKDLVKMPADVLLNNFQQNM